MSDDRTEYKKNLKVGPSVRTSTTVIQRTPAGHMRGAPISSQRSSMRMSMGPSYASGTISGISQKGVNDVITVRDKEKKQMQGLNERLAGYIEKVRFLEAQNKTFIAEIERLKKSKGFDVSEIKELYEQELAECKKIIKDLTEEKAGFDSTLVGLQDALDDEKREHAATEKIVNDLRSKLDRLNDQMGEYEGEIASLRGRLNNMDDENKTLKATIKKLQEDNNRIRQDLDEETRNRIRAENECQQIQDALQFDLNISHAEIKELTALLERDTGMKEVHDIWKGELQKAVNDLSKEYAVRIEDMRDNYAMQMEAMMHKLETGANRDSNEIGKLKEEIRRLKSKFGEVNPRLAELEGENASLKKQLIMAEQALDELRRDLEAELVMKDEELRRANTEIERILAELNTLQDAKLSLELEISCYKKLLDTEEQTLQNTVERAADARSSEAEKLAGIIQQSS